MSRIGKKPITIPSGVEVKQEGSVLIFKKGNVTKELDTKNNVNISFEDGKLVFSAKNDERQSKAYWGTYRALANNIIVGITDGFTRVLEINGVGYKAAVKGKVLELSLGFSHLVNYQLPDVVDASVDKNQIILKSTDKQVIGQVAAQIRAYRPPEPYKGKGIKYAEEHITRKAGKTSKK